MTSSTVIQQRIKLLSERDPVRNANIIKKLKRRARRAKIIETTEKKI
jgi:ERCC4-type nuclease